MGVPDPRGSTFAERAAAARGDKDFEKPEVDSSAPSTFASRAGGKSPEVKPTENSTFGSRAGGEKKPAKVDPKQVDAEVDEVEDKAVKPASKRTAKKS